MRCSPQPVGSDDDSGTSSNFPGVFSDGASDNLSESASEPASSGDDSEDSDDDSILDDEEEERELTALHYLEEAESLNVSQLRQKRYSPKTQSSLDDTRDYWNRFCYEGKHDPVERFGWLSDSEETIRFLKAFFSWRCGRRRSKTGRRTPGIKYKTSLETFWKWWHLVYKAEVGQGLSKDTTVKILDVLAMVAKERNLLSGRRPKATMYIEDVAEFARVLLSTTEMTFQCGWLRIQLLLFCQLAAITGSRPGALLNLRYRNLMLTLVRNPDGGRPQLFIYLTPEFTKTFLGEKEQNTFPIPEIIFDPTLVLSPHVFLLGMLFRIKAFKNFSKDGLVVDCPENLYNLGVLNGLGEQELKLNDEVLDRFVFCQALRESDGIRIALEKQLTEGALRYRMKRGGEITGFEQVTKPYCLRYGAAKAFNDSPDVTNELQNVMLQHASINTFVKHYSVGIHVDAQAIVRGLPAQKQLMRFAASMSRSIDPRRPYKLEDTSIVSKVPNVCKIQKKVIERKEVREKMKRAFEMTEWDFQRKFGDYLQQKKLKQELQGPARLALDVVERREREYMRATQRHTRAQRVARNEWQRQRNRLVRENLVRYKNEQPVIDSERQLAGKVVDEECMGALERTGYMTPQHIILIDTILTMPGSTVEKEYQRRIAAINAVITFCDVEEGFPTRRPKATQKRPATNNLPSAPPAKRQERPSPEDGKTTLSLAFASVCIKARHERPTICFLCLGNPRLPDRQRVKSFRTPGSLGRHFVDIHVIPYPKDMRVKCSICREDLESKSALMNHAEGVHGTVSRRPLSALGPI
ncbi:hypothetical protein BO82DRAFT_409090 [Aspergillus uvarum CBS 121591]|uniref:C2H2-type domain-containing protein n=1 Tax=Aspergillus uvarum CBS 121591 TaxID=1448315 RepID=A0A319BW77_9EURO|nr:hypothetical protein BO82DRAFT_409090 [Aspergillus uvarum CBS 121591]PYH75799.1 hypothetical protein BO82DRAFT_409090 [Aspergillus uvarum CBS 121591]